MDAQLRITLWPDARLKVPDVEHRDVHVDAEGWVHFDGYASYKPLQDELGIRGLLEVDRADMNSLAGFVTEHGIFDRTPLTAVGEGIDEETIKRPKGLVLHAAELAIYVAWLQGAVRHWLAVVDGDPVITAWEAAGIADPERRIPRQEIEDDIAWAWFAKVMNRGLERFPPHVMVVPATPSTRELLPEYGEPTVDLFTGLTVQLFNLMFDDLPVLYCHNETCDRRFVRQSGRAVKGQYRTEGVKFCSSACAKAQVQREYRRRKRSSR
jgi:hypothetical protein